MAIPALQTILDRIETWPLERQERAAELLELLDEGDGDLTISDEDAAEIERRMNDPNAETISLEEFDRAFADYLR
jgi:hypothetical protein